ncbi:hypothetical protein F4804DRAFT_350398 [Jackrogersella minutella]|nr:hypothetical protein F4804DRAFT_350398 [Jackrogersella minutella]
MSSYARRQDVSPSAASEAALSTGAIAGIAVGGAVLLFAALAAVLIKLAKRQDRRRASNAAFHDVCIETGTNEIGPRRLRKKSIVGEQMAAHILDKEDDDTGREESRSRKSSLNVASPARTRQNSYSIGDDSQDIQIQLQKSRSPDKQRGYGVYQHRRKTSWIDEDALHGPTITSPTKTKEKHRRMVSWFDGGLSRSLSRLSTRSGMGEASPTLPYTEGQAGHQFETPVESPSEREGSQGVHYPGYTTTPSPTRQQQQQIYASPQGAYGPTNLTSSSPGSNNTAQSPPDIVHNPRYRNQVSFQAAQQLAGTARLPNPINVPQGQGQTPRPPILKHSATDTELTEILRMTAERLQDGHRSARRQTLMMPCTPGRKPHDGSQVHLGGVRMDPNYGSPDRGDISPAKSHKSAPATMSYVELEGCTPTQSLQRQMQTPRHSRHPSHNPRMSQVSMISEPDSLVAPKRESVSEVRTALSSPSRVTRSNEPTPSPQGSKQQSRPFSNGSSMSSALSTLYSMDDASIRSPPVSELKFSSSPIDTPRRTPEKVLSAFGMLNPKRNSGADRVKSPKLRWDDDDIPPPLRIRRGTLGGSVVPNNTPASRPTSHQNAKSMDLPKTRSSFMIDSSRDKDDPFTAETTPKNPARLSKVFSPLPVELPSGKADQKTCGRNPSQESQYSETPTPSPTRRAVPPSPRSILNSPSNPPRAPSPAVSEAGLSSVYDSYTYTHESPPGSEGSSSTSTLTGAAAGSRISFRVPDYGPQHDEDAMEKIQPRQHQPVMAPAGSLLRPRRGGPSDGSVYSQDGEDRVPPMRAPTVRRGKSVRLSSAITELRRMNSQISVMSDQSTASTTLPLMRGGGASPGRQTGGGKNYLALGGGLKTNGRLSLPSAGGAESPRLGASVRRSRRETVVLQGGDVRRSGNVGTGSIKHTSQLLTHATRLKREETVIKRASVESLYDNDGFLKG